MVSQEISPSEIRRIRERLGLSQREAGRVIGGGPRAFQKYEAGTVQPAAAVVQLLRLLDMNPTALAALRGERETGPFQVDGERLVGAISPQALTSILRRLLAAEALSHDLPQDGIQVSDNVTAADGGEDGRIEWTEGLDRTTFLPGRLCQFQLKTGNFSTTDAKSEVIGRDRQIKPMVRSALEQDGHYILLCTQALTQQGIQIRKNNICAALRSAGMGVNEDRIQVRSADQLAHWINHHPSVAIWLNEQTGQKPTGPFRSSDHWRQRTEHENSPWIEDDRLPALNDHLRHSIAQTHGVFRIVGPSGIGKSRLVLEALAPSAATNRNPVADLVMYADLAESTPDEVNRVIQSLVDNRQRAVAVVDNCQHEVHRILAGIALQSASRVSLITIDYETPAEMQASVLAEIGPQEVGFRLPEAPSTVVEKVIETACPELPPEDFRRLARFSRGNPEIAHKAARAWPIGRPVAHTTDEDIADAYVAGRQTGERGLLMKAARLLAAFRLVALDAVQDDVRDDLEEVASFGEQLTEGNLRSAYERMIDRGAARRRGRFVTIEPRAIAVRLAARQWREWSKSNRRTVLGGGSTSPALKVSAAKQLAFLNDTQLGREVVRDVVYGEGGPFDGHDGLLKPGHAEVLHSLAQIDPSLVANAIERSLDKIADLDDIRDDVRRHLVRTLEKIAFDARSFDIGGRLLLRLALAENEHWGNNATGQFKALFPVVLGNTAADGNARLELLDDLCQSNDPGQQRIVVEALIKGSATHHFSRRVGPEIHGAHPALEPWHPRTEEVALAYLEGCVNRLVGFTSGTGPVADIARRGLGIRLRSLAAYRLIDLVEHAVETVGEHCEVWPEALEALGHFLAFDIRKMPDNDERRNTEARVRSLIGKLEPQSLAARVRSLVTEMSWDYLIEDYDDVDHQQLRQRQDEAVREFAIEMLRNPGAIEEHLPEISCFSPDAAGKQRMTQTFGLALAETAASPLDWLGPIIAALHDIPLKQRDFGMLAGYLAGLPAEHATAVAAFKQRCAGDSTLAPAFPRICSYLTVTASDIEQALSMLQARNLQPSHLTWWSGGGALQPIDPEILVPLFDELFGHSAEGYCCALELMAMYAFQKVPEQVLDEMVPQLRRAAENLTRWLPEIQPAPLTWSHFEKLMTRLLAKGRDDPDACSAAMALSSVLVEDREDSIEIIQHIEHMVKPLIRPLLETFPEISWQIVGAAALSKSVAAMRLEFLLGGRLSTKRNDPPILQLPEEVLFAWCRANNDDAAAFAAKTLPFLESYDRGNDAGLHPRMGRLIDEFGDRAKVRKALDSNIFSGGFFGSASSFYGQYNKALSRLQEGHSSSAVRRWAGETLQALAGMIEQFGRRDDEWDAQNED